MSALKPIAATAAVLAAGLFIALAHTPGARAGNTVHPRTPVLWPDAPCIQTVDRSVDPNISFTYEIPAEDTLLSFDEFEDSRSHQFIGFCRQWPAGRPPPRYVSSFDLDRAVQAGFEQAELLDDPESTLETSALWAGCWTRITADDQRRPITFAAAAEPVIWDSTGIAAGTWLIAGYTWEPPYNLWSRAPWVLRVTDGPAASEPPQAAVSIADTADYLYPDELLELQICVDATPGSTLTIAWAPSKPPLLEWVSLEPIALDGPSELTLPFSPAPESAGLTIVLRATVEQPQGDAYAGHALGSVIVFGEAGDGDGDTSGDGDTGTDTGDTSGSETGDGSSADQGGGGGCSVDPGPSRGLGELAGLGLFALMLLRRRHGRESRLDHAPELSPGQGSVMTNLRPPNDARPSALTLTAALLLGAAGVSACKGDDAASEGETGDDPSGDGDGDGDGDTSDETGTETGDEQPETATLTHRFGTRELAPYEETQPCVQWTLDNEVPVYVQAVTLSNLGYFHHSNWFVVPDALYPGEDGYFNCNDRGFNELSAATAGTVLYAQSTQSFVEEQRTGAGAVIKIPPHHKVVADLHMLNVGPDSVSTDLFMTLELIHPKQVDVVLAAIRASYIDLDIPAGEISKFTGVCEDFGQRYADATGGPMDMKLHYVLPHYHYLGNYFNLSFMGGPLDGQDVFTVNGFDASAIGGVFDPPLDLTGVEGVRYTCGYDNWRDVNVGWGIGDQEMCVMLGLAETKVLMDLSVTGGTTAVGVDENGVLEYEGPCGVLAVPKNPALGLPTQAERDAPLNVPQSGDEAIPPIPACNDHDPGVAPLLPPTLDNVFAAVFAPSCMFNACHGVSGQAAGLNLQAPDLLTELLTHEVQGNPGAALVEPGDPDSSWLYQILSRCEPQNDGGVGQTHMPRNAPTLLHDQSIALVREWIAGGANP